MVTEPERYYRRMVYPLDIEPRNPTMDKKLIINVATTGGFLKKEQNPNQPYTPEEIAPQAIEAYKAGAAAWHIHVRDKEGFPIAKDPKPIKEAIDMVLAECPDIIIQGSAHVDDTKRGAAGLLPVFEPLIEASAKIGRKYYDTAVLVPARVGPREMDREVLVDFVEYLQGHGIKPEFQIYFYNCIDNVIRWVIQPGILSRPYVINIISGSHAYRFMQPTMPEPWGHIYLMTMMQQIPEGSVVGATIGGRNWLPLTVTAIMQGVDIVRIGMEDALWMYPHKDEKISKSADVVRKIATIARELGREIATPAEAREILGLT